MVADLQRNSELPPLKLAIYLYSLGGEISIFPMVRLRASVCGLVCVGVQKCQRVCSSLQSSLSTHHLRGWQVGRVMGEGIAR